MGEDIPFAERHDEFWRWVWDLQRGVRPRPFVAIWPRGSGKSTVTEMACVAAGSQKRRRYALYICEKQDQADDHVANIAALLESATVERYYPLMAERALGKYGNSRGWRRNRLRTAANFTVDAIGLDVAARGVKLEDMRPDLLIFDDIDSESDSLETIAKKIRTITTKLLPAGSGDAAVLAVQNLIHYEGVFAQLAGVASETADYLSDRIVSGPHPAIVGLQTEKQPDGKYKITGGTPTWAGQDIARCQSDINQYGLRAFLSEMQHSRAAPVGQAFPEWDNSVHVIDSFPIPANWPRWRAVDYGWAVPYCCLWAARSPDGTIYVYREMYGAGRTAEQQALEVRINSSGERYFASVGDPAMWADTREGKKYESVASQYHKAGVKIVPATNARIIGWSRLHELLSWGEKAPPRLKVFRTCTNLIRTMPLLIRDPHKPEDVDSHIPQDDHAPDAARYLVMAAPWLTSRKTRKSTMVVSGARKKKDPLDDWIDGGRWSQEAP